MSSPGAWCSGASTTPGPWPGPGECNPGCGHRWPSPRSPLRESCRPAARFARGAAVRRTSQAMPLTTMPSGDRAPDLPVPVHGPSPGRSGAAQAADPPWPGPTGNNFPASPELSIVSLWLVGDFHPVARCDAELGSEARIRRSKGRARNVMAEKISAGLLHHQPARAPVAPVPWARRVPDARIEGSRPVDDRLGPARGILLSAAIALPLWLVIGLALAWFFS
jgi:hypothetical protein